MFASQRRQTISLQSQRGVALVLVAVAMVALVAMVGFALDVGHATLNKARLQNAVDAAALAAAKILDETDGNTTAATNEATTAFAANANSSGDLELKTAYANNNVSVTVQYSATLPPFTIGAPNGPYVRVKAVGFSAQSWLAEVIGINNVVVSATAVAGPSPTIYKACNIVPLMVCGTSPSPTGTYFGYTPGQAVALKQSAPGSPSEVGPGNFQLIQLGGSGASVVRQNLAGTYAGCANIGETLQTQPGNETGPTTQGIDTRFNEYSGGQISQSADPPDVVTTQQSPRLTVGSGGPPYPVQGTISFTYTTYQTRESNGPYDVAPPTGVKGRRVLTVPIGSCTGTSGGQTSVPVVGFGCFWLLQDETQQGNSDYILGQFLGGVNTGIGGQGTGNCSLNGTPGPAPNSGPGPYIIQLYRDPNSGDS